MTSQTYEAKTFPRPHIFESDKRGIWTNPLKKLNCETLKRTSTILAKAVAVLAQQVTVTMNSTPKKGFAGIACSHLKLQFETKLLLKHLEVKPSCRPSTDSARLRARVLSGGRFVKNILLFH